MYDLLWEDHPKVKKIRTESKAEGLSEGLSEGLRWAVINSIATHFPDLIEKARMLVPKIQEPAALKLLYQQIEAAPDEETARLLLLLSTSHTSAS